MRSQHLELASESSAVPKNGVLSAADKIPMTFSAQS